jgi:hypothetical protein
VEEPDKINSKLDTLIKSARESKPVMDLTEVRNLIASAPVSVTAPKQNNALKYLMFLGLFLAVTGSYFLLTNSKTETEMVGNTDNHSNVVTNPTTPTVQASEVEQNALDNSVTEEVENAKSNQLPNETVANDLPVTTKNNDAASAAVKNKPTTENNTVVADLPSEKLIGNKTSIVTGSDMEVTLNDGGNKINMKVKNDNTVKELTVNGKRIAESDFAKYKNYTDQGIKVAAAERIQGDDVDVNIKTAEEQRRDEINTSLFNAFTNQLKKDKLVSDTKYSFKLNATEMVIDGKAMPQTTQAKYLKLFETTSGRSIGNSTFKFEHGVK